MPEFLTVRRVGEVLEGFRPGHRTGVELVGLAEALGRVAARDVVAPESLPGFRRAAVDGFAVRAADSYGASESLPAYLSRTGEIAMGMPAGRRVGVGEAVAVPTGGAVPDGADAVVMIEHTAEAVAGLVEVMRSVAPGEGVVAADEDVVSGTVVVGRGRSLRAVDLALLAALGVTSIPVAARPRVAIVSTGDEVVEPSAAVRPGQVRDATTSGIAALVVEAGGVPVTCGIFPDDATRLESALLRAMAEADLVVVSAGSSVGLRDLTAEVIGRLGAPGIWCHGIAIKPGKPTLLAECDGVPVIGLPGNPTSALVVFRLIGMQLVRLVAGAAAAPLVGTVRARLAVDLPSAAGRLDVVQVSLAGGVATPVFGRSAILSPLSAADGYLVIGEDATGLYEGSEVEVIPYR